MWYKVTVSSKNSLTEEEKKKSSNSKIVILKFLQFTCKINSKEISENYQNIRAAFLITLQFTGTYMPKVSRFEISTVTGLPVDKHLFKVNNKDNRATPSIHRALGQYFHSCTWTCSSHGLKFALLPAKTC